MSLSVRECFASTVKELTFHESKWNSEGWKNTWAGINQDVLNDAFNQHGLVRSIFSAIGEISQRNCKLLDRVKEKMTQQAPGRENYFRPVSDFVAFRVRCDVNEIQGKIDHIREIVLANGGEFNIKGASNECPYGTFMTSEKKHTDITQFVQVFLERVGYPIEFQIGHEFALHTFSQDSAIRENSKCGKTNLWDKDFYIIVRKYILDKFNGEIPGSKDVIQALAEDIHQNNVPEELQVILNKI